MLLQNKMRYAKTPAGQQAFKERSPLLSARQRSAFLLFDGVKPLQAVLQAVAGLGVTMADVEHLLAQGFLEPCAPTRGKADAAGAQDSATSTGSGDAEPSAADEAQASPASRTPVDRYQQAYPLAVKLVASLGLRGFRLNLAVEAAGSYEELLALFPKIQEAVGAREAMGLEAALKG
jgi:hypothetical protein